MSNLKISEAPATRTWLSKFFDNDSFFNDDFFTRNTMPAVNVRDNEKNYQVEMAIPGFKKDEFDIKVENGIISITGESKSEKKEKKDNYTRKEFQYSSFSRSFSLPENADPEQVNAKYDNGILNLEIGKKTTGNNHKKQITVS